MLLDLLILSSIFCFISNVIFPSLLTTRNVSGEEDAQRLHGDWDNLSEWVNTWQINNNLDKMEDVHFGGQNRKAEYHLKITFGK